MTYEEVKAKVEGLIKKHLLEVKEMEGYAEACRVEPMLEHLVNAEDYNTDIINVAARAFSKGIVTGEEYEALKRKWREETKRYDDFAKFIVDAFNKNCKCHLSID